MRQASQIRRALIVLPFIVFFFHLRSRLDAETELSAERSNGSITSRGVSTSAKGVSTETIYYAS